MTQTTTAKNVDFKMIHKAFARQMVRLLDRWQDEREFERGAFLAHFKRIGSRIGIQVQSIGVGRNLVLGILFPHGGFLLRGQISLSTSGEFRVRVLS